MKPEEAQGKLGGGPLIYVLDGGMIAHRRLRDFVVRVAEKKKIPYQFSLMEGGATDGRPIHVHARGVPALFIGVPVRYIHCHAGIMNADDYDRTVVAAGGNREAARREGRGGDHRRRLSAGYGSTIFRARNQVGRSRWL